MPNWCSNSITIQGSTETIKTLWDDAQSNWKNNDYGLLDAMVPMPTALKGTTSPTPHQQGQQRNNARHNMGKDQNRTRTMGGQTEN